MFYLYRNFMMVENLKYAATVLCVMILLFIPNFVFAKQAEQAIDRKENVQQVREGNFILPGAPLPGPLVSFGQNILGKGRMEAGLGNTTIIGKDNFFTQIDFGFLYGITNNFSILFEIPYSPKNQYDSEDSHGFQDITIQLEYAVFNYNTRYTSNSVTVVGNMTAPTGSSTVQPALGQGSPSFFLGSTYNHTGVNWIFFLSPGISYTTDWIKHNFSGYEIFYQLGIGRNITSSPSWILAWLLEFDGTYVSTNRSIGYKGRNFGGNVIYATPSLAFAFNKFIFQIGAGYPIVQTLNNHERKQYLSVDSSLYFIF